MSVPELPILSVTEFNSLVNDIMAKVHVWVQGEVSGYRVSQNKWVTFDLKDKGSKINCFMTIYQLDQVIADGMEIKVLGTPRIYVPYGRYSFTVQRVEPVGEGALRRAFELTKAKLETEGLFAPEHKKPIPRFPQTIGLVTSPEAAAYTDFLRILENRWGGVEVIVRPSLVQGNEAPAQLADALAWFNRYHPVDIIVLTRGGGSLEDLQAFNSESVCRAVYASRIPVICGVGHERDTTLAELVADVRASTPSNAAERCVPDKKEIDWQLSQHAKTMEQCLRGRIQSLSWSLQEQMTRMEHQVRSRLGSFDQLQQRLVSSFHGYQTRLAGLAHSIETITRRINVTASHIIERQGADLSRLSQLLSSFNPKGVLQRGYAIARGSDGKVIRTLKQVKSGQMVQTEVADGAFTSQVTEKGGHIVENGRLF